MHMTETLQECISGRLLDHTGEGFHCAISWPFGHYHAVSCETCKFQSAAVEDTREQACIGHAGEMVFLKRTSQSFSALRS